MTLGLATGPLTITQTFPLKMFYLLEHGGLPHVFRSAVHLDFVCAEVEGVILSHFYSLPASFMLKSWGCRLDGDGP